MTEQKKHNIYTQADIQKYLSGNMSNPEMHAIEKAAMDDPLLAEAMEGYEGMEQKDWGKELAALKDKLESSQQSVLAPVYSFRKWWRVAAAVTILMIGMAVSYLFNRNNTKETPAIARVAVEDPVSAAPVDSNNTVKSITANETANDSEIKIPTNATEIATLEKETTTLLAAIKKEKQSDSFIYKPSAGPAYNYNKDITASAKTEDYADKNDLEIINANNESVSRARANKTNEKSLSVQNQAGNNSNNSINAQVVTADDKPVAFANVSVQKNKQPVYTDAKGNFKIPVTDSTVNGVVTSAGYVPKKFSFKNSATENKIVLQQDSINVTTISSGISKSASKPILEKNIENADEDAEPSIGWYEYNNYINDNLVLPSEAKQKNIHGVVEVFVKLKNNGDISKVKVDKPLCPECDAEAVRLVKEGPRWEVKKNKAKKAKVKIKF